MNGTVIGFDCGATHTRARIWKNGAELDRNDKIPGINFDVISMEEASGIMIPVLKNLVKYGEAEWVVGMAGLDDHSEIAEAEQWWKRVLTAAGMRFKKLLVVSDIELVLWAGSKDGVGIGLIAGTGSNCVGRNKKGKEVKVSGMSDFLSDEGSGFALGWRCLHLITKMDDGRVVRTKLLNETLKMYKAKNLVELKNFIVDSEMQKMEIARAALPLLAAAKRGERLAKEAVNGQAYELVQMVATVNRRLSPIHVMDVYLAGSLFRNKYYLNSFRRKLRRLFRDQKIKLIEPIGGALNIAIDKQ